MTAERSGKEFPEHAGENRRIWDANARWGDDRIGDGNGFQTVLIEPATERLLETRAGDIILDAACGAGRFARRMAVRGARIVAFDDSSAVIARAWNARRPMRPSSRTCSMPPGRTIFSAWARTARLLGSLPNCQNLRRHAECARLRQSGPLWGVAGAWRPGR